MAKKRPITQAVIPVATTVRRMSEYQIDETKNDLGAKFGHIRDGQIFLSVGLTRRMEERWGVFSAVVTSTDEEESTVTVFKASPRDSEVVPVNRYGTQNAAVFSFYVPLKKLNLNPGKNRQFEVIPFEQPIEDGPVAFVFEMEKRTSLPRDTKQEEADVAAGSQGQASGDATVADDVKV